MNDRQQIKNKIQLIWGAALILVGIGVFVRIPQVMPKLAQMGQSPATIGFVRICFYIMGIILLGGGIKKIINYINPTTTESSDKSTGSGEN